MDRLTPRKQNLPAMAVAGVLTSHRVKRQGVKAAPTALTVSSHVLFAKLVILRCNIYGI